MLADIETTTLRGTVQRIPVETVVHPIVKVTLEINIAKAKSSIPHFGIQPLQISLVSTSSLRSTWQI